MLLKEVCFFSLHSLSGNMCSRTIKALFPSFSSLTWLVKGKTTRRRVVQNTGGGCLILLADLGCLLVAAI